MKENIIYFFYLLLGIIAETIATSSLVYTKEFTKLWSSIGVLILYVVGLFFLTLCLRVIPVGIAYAIWAGAGIVFVVILSYILHKQKLDYPAIIGVGLIVCGIIVVNIFSKSIKH